MGIFGTSNFSIMNLLGQYRAISGINNSNAAIMANNQNQINFAGQLPNDTFELSDIAEADKNYALSNAQHQTQLLMHEAQLEALEKKQNEQTA